MKCVSAPQQPWEHSTGLDGPQNIIFARDTTGQRRTTLLSMGILVAADTLAVVVVVAFGLVVVSMSLVVVVAVLVCVDCLV